VEELEPAFRLPGLEEDLACDGCRSLLERLEALERRGLVPGSSLARWRPTRQARCTYFRLSWLLHRVMGYQHLAAGTRDHLHPPPCTDGGPAPPPVPGPAKLLGDWVWVASWRPLAATECEVPAAGELPTATDIQDTMFSRTSSGTGRAS
jgi:hypothetical protein